MYTVLTHIGAWVKTKNNILYPDAILTSVLANHCLKKMFVQALERKWTMDFDTQEGTNLSQ